MNAYELIGLVLVLGWFTLLLWKNLVKPRILRKKIEQCTTRKEALSLRMQALSHSAELAEFALKKQRELYDIEQEQEFERDLNDALGSEEKLAGLLAKVTAEDPFGTSDFPFKFRTRILKVLHPFTEKRIGEATKLSELLILEKEHRISDDLKEFYECSLIQLIVEEAVVAVSEDDECFAPNLLDDTSLGKLIAAKKNVLGVTPPRAFILEAIDSALRYELTILWGH